MVKNEDKEGISSIENLMDYYRLETSKDLDPLMERIGDSRYVLLGEASHGTHEYYTWRTAISKRLIEEKGFSFIAVEGDWPDCYKINRWVKNYAEGDLKIHDVLRQFKRWPTWMWANYEIAALAEWLREHNANRLQESKAGFYGLDVYSLWESMHSLVEYLQKEDPATAKLAQAAIHCFEPYREEDSYTKALSSLEEDCRNEVIELLKEVRKKAPQYNTDPEAGLNAEINSLVAANAENYYQAMVSFNEQSWNVRDKHMVETLNHIMKHHGPEAKVIVWEHNTHIGDARATDMARHGLLNVGQLVRQEQNEKDVILVGFGSYQGSVMAGSDWGEAMTKMTMPPARENSVEEILHRESPANKLLLFDKPKLKERFSQKLRHRAIGVVYHPDREWGNYVPTELSKRYDAFLYIDTTNALHPIHLTPDKELVPLTYPFRF